MKAGPWGKLLGAGEEGFSLCTENRQGQVRDKLRHPNPLQFDKQGSALIYVE
ncbi:MAG: hypothetical protein ACLUOI_22660 [Eisenbergiella sp.]